MFPASRRTATPVGPANPCSGVPPSVRSSRVITRKWRENWRVLCGIVPVDAASTASGSFRRRHGPGIETDTAPFERPPPPSALLRCPGILRSRVGVPSLPCRPYGGQTSLCHRPTVITPSRHPLVRNARTFRGLGLASVAVLLCFRHVSEPLVLRA